MFPFFYAAFVKKVFWFCFFFLLCDNSKMLFTLNNGEWQTSVALQFVSNF